MNTARFADNAAANRSSRHRSARWLAHTIETLLVWQDRARSRRMLGALDDHMLRDIGLDKTAVSTEVDKPFWKP